VTLLFKPFTNAEPGSFGELLEVLGFLYCCLSLMAPIFWYASRGIEDPNRLRRYLTLICVPFIWSIVLTIRAARSLRRYLDRDLMREWLELLPKRKPEPVLRSPRDLGLYD
jgi:hypothetical protein